MRAWGARGRDETEELHAPEASEALQRDAAGGEHADPRRQRAARVADGEQLARSRGLAQPGREVGRPADVVVAVEDQHPAVREAAAQREAMTLVARDELGRRRDRRADLDADEHGAVAQPLRDPHAAAGRELARQRPEAGQRLDGRVLAVGRDELREAAQVHERERALDERDRVGELARLLGAADRGCGPDRSVTRGDLVGLIPVGDITPLRL